MNKCTMRAVHQGGLAHLPVTLFVYISICPPRGHYSPGAKGLKWRFFDHESEQAEFGLKL